MENLKITFLNVLGMLFYMVPGFILRKTGLLKERDIPAVSQVMIYIATPFMVIAAFLKMEFDWAQFGEMLLFFFVTLVLQAAFFAVIFLAVRKHTQDTKMRVFCMISSLGNVGYFGMPIVMALFPEHPVAACYVTMTMLSLDVLLFTVGIYCVSGDRKQISVRSALLNPASIGLYIVLPFYFTGLGVKLPDTVKNCVQSLAGMAAPLSMIVLGIRLASGSLKDIFTERKTYVATVLKLIVFPVFSYGLLYFLPFTNVFKSVILVLCAAPTSSVGLSLAELHGGGQRLAANTLLLSTIFCIVTLPVMVWLFVR